MNAAAKNVTTLNIAQGACSTWRAARGGWLGACAGHAWVTVEGDPEDYWLAPGEALPVAPGERVRVGGWNEAVSCEWLPLDGEPFAVAESAVQAVPPRWWAGLHAGFGRWVPRGALWPRRTRIGAWRAVRMVRMARVVR